MGALFESLRLATLALLSMHFRIAPSSASISLWFAREGLLTQVLRDNCVCDFYFERYKSLATINLMTSNFNYHGKFG